MTEEDEIVCNPMNLYDEMQRRKKEDAGVLSQTPFTSHQFLDNDGRPDGGMTYGRGFTIAWQRGPLGRDLDRTEPNGAFVEDILKAVIDRLQFYQRTEFACDRNYLALRNLYDAMHHLGARTQERENQGIEGTHTVHA